jgi:hypothetical protein
VTGAAILQISPLLVRLTSLLLLLLLLSQG